VRLGAGWMDASVEVEGWLWWMIFMDSFASRFVVIFFLFLDIPRLLTNILIYLFLLLVFVSYVVCSEVGVLYLRT
jgi:hypothetical protein